MRRLIPFALVLGTAFAAAAGSSGASVDDPIHKIRHVVIVMQENRSFDSYFGTFPGADGIPMVHGIPAACLPDPESGHCVRPYHDTADHNGGGPSPAQGAPEGHRGSRRIRGRTHRRR